MASPRPVKRKSKYARRERFFGYMAFIKTLPCMCCGRKYGTEAAHCGDRPFGQKCSDMETLPLCKDDHTEGKHSIHKDAKHFWEFWGINREEMFKKYQQMYAELRKGMEINE